MWQPGSFSDRGGKSPSHEIAAKKGVRSGEGGQGKGLLYGSCRKQVKRGVSLRGTKDDTLPPKVHAPQKVQQKKVKREDGGLRNKSLPLAFLSEGKKKGRTEPSKSGKGESFSFGSTPSSKEKRRAAREDRF